VADGYGVEWDDGCSGLTETLAREAEWTAQEASNDTVQWGVTDATGGWEVTLPASPVWNDSGWPGLAAQIDKCYGTWGLFPTDTFEVIIDVV
jgi:hypothetical protein